MGGLFKNPIVIAGVLGDSHGALAGQMCFEEGLGKVTYGTGSSVMVNIGEKLPLLPVDWSLPSVLPHLEKYSMLLKAISIVLVLPSSG